MYLVLVSYKYLGFLTSHFPKHLLFTSTAAGLIGTKRLPMLKVNESVIGIVKSSREGSVYAQGALRMRRVPRAAVTSQRAFTWAGPGGRDGILSRQTRLPPACSPSPAAPASPAGRPGSTPRIPDLCLRERVRGRQEAEKRSRISTSGTMKAFLCAAVGELREELERY